MHYLIDGHNLIGQMPDITLSDPDDEARLVLVLRRWAAISRKRRITVIFDGGLPGGEATNLSKGRVRAFFASLDRTADDLLIGRVRRAVNPAAYTLVSSDRFVRAAAKARGMPHINSAEFARVVRETLETRAYGSRSANSTNKRARQNQRWKDNSEEDDPFISREEVDEWLELFGPIAEKPFQPDPLTSSKPSSSDRSKDSRRISRDDSPELLKGGRRRLKSEEIDDWMELFNQSEGE